MEDENYKNRAAEINGEWREKKIERKRKID